MQQSYPGQPPQFAGPPHPGGPPGPGGAAAQPNRIDPLQIPRPSPQGPDVVVYETRSSEPIPPPPSSSRFVVRDRGCCSPRFIRSTLYYVPQTNDLQTTCNMPLALVVAPMALPDPADDPIQVVDLGEMGPVRCGRCKAYVNPFMKWTNGGKNFTCNFCGYNNACPEPYVCYLGPDNRRRDANERPELSRGTVEFAAPAEYMVRPPMPVVHFFLIDVTQQAITTGATAATCKCIEEVLDSIQGGDRALVGIATFDNSVHFYALRPGQSQPQMLVMADIADVYAPLGAPLTARLSQCRDELVTLLQAIPTYFAHNTIRDSCGAAAIEAAIEVLKPTGGKVHAFLSLLPGIGSRGLKTRPDYQLTLDKAEKEKQGNILSADPSYKSLGEEAAAYQIAIDLFLAGQLYMDVSTLSDLPMSTGGSVYNYSPFNPALDQDQLLNDLKWNVARPQALEGILRVRCSAGLEVEAYSGAFSKRVTNPTDIDLAALDCDKALVARIVHVDKLTPGTEAYFQCALLYTTTSGARRIRVHTLALPVADSMAALFKGSDLDAQLAVLTRQVATGLPGSTLAAGRELVINRVVATLFSYRRYCASVSSNVQLILPEALKLYILYSLGIHKGAGLRSDAKSDERALWLFQVLTSPCARLMPMLLPRLVAVHQLLEQVAAQPDMPLERLLMSASLFLSSEVLHPGGVYLLENGHDALLYLDKATEPALVSDLMGVGSMEELARHVAPLPLVPRDGPASRLLAELLQLMRLERCSYMRTRVVRKADPLETLFRNLMVEDLSNAGASYVDYLCTVHKLIQTRMS